MERDREKKRKKGKRESERGLRKQKTEIEFGERGDGEKGREIEASWNIQKAIKSILYLSII